MPKIEIKLNGLGKYQIWKDDKVLYPRKLEWKNHYQSKHDFMFYDTLDQAESAVKQVITKDLGQSTLETIKTYII